MGEAAVARRVAEHNASQKFYVVRVVRVYYLAWVVRVVVAFVAVVATGAYNAPLVAKVVPFKSHFWAVAALRAVRFVTVVVVFAYGAYRNQVRVV